MPVNVEIKARVKDVAALRERVQALAEQDPELLRQEDTFFCTRAGRLKLRVFDGGRGELIYYERDDNCGPVPSTYLVSPVEDVSGLRESLASLLGVRGIVRKEREYFRLGRTRVHIDQVESLGAFLELEVVLAAGESAEAGRAEALALMEALSVRSEDLLSAAYIDLVESRAG